MNNIIPGIFSLALLVGCFAVPSMSHAQTITPGQGSLKDCSGNVWTISVAGAVMEGDNYTPDGGGTSHLAIVDCTIYGEDAHSGAWFTRSNGQWASSAAPPDETPAPPENTIVSGLGGAFLSADHSQQTLLGFACMEGSNTQLNLRVFRNGPATYDEAVEIPGPFVANESMEPGLQTLCGSKIGHRFSIIIDNNLRTNYPGQKLVVYTVNPLDQSMVQVPETDAAGRVLAQIYSPNVFFVPPPVADANQNMANIQNTLDQAYSCQANPSSCANTGTSPPEVQVLLAGGTYDLCNTPLPAPPSTTGGNVCLVFQNRENLIFGGSRPDTKIVLQTPDSGYILNYKSTNIQINDFSFDMEIPPFNQGVITGVNRASDGRSTVSIDVQVDPGFQTFADPIYQYAGGVVIVMDKKEPRVKRDVPNFMTLTYTPTPDSALGQYAHATLLSDGKTWRLTLDPANSGMWKSPNVDLPLVSAGDRFVFRTGSDSGIVSESSTNVALQRFNIYAAGGLATLFGQDWGTSLVSNMILDITPGSSRLLSSNADGVHFQNDRGQVIVRHSTIAHNGDDGIAVYATGNLSAVAIPNTKEIVFSVDRQIYPDDQIQLLSPLGKILGIFTASEANNVTCPSGTGWCTRLALDSPLPTGAEIGDIGYIYNAAGNGAVIEDNQFISHRGIGVLDQSPGSAIVSNTFTDLNGQAIIIGNGTTYGTLQPGPLPDNVTIQSNSMTGGDNYWGDLGNGVWLTGNTPQILVRTMIPGSQTNSQILGADGPSSVNINSNRFADSSSAAIEIDAGHGIQMNNNLVTAQPATIRNAGGEILFCGGQSLSINGLAVQDPRASTTSDVEINKSDLSIANLSILPSSLTVGSEELASTPCFR